MTRVTDHCDISQPFDDSLLGVNGTALSVLPGYIGTVFTGAIWSTVYRKTSSLRCRTVSHFVVDLLSVSVIVFLNRAVCS